MYVVSKTEEFKARVYNSKGADFEVTGTYVNAKTKIKMTHNICGYSWSTLPSNFLKTKFGCPKCSGNAKGTHEEFVNKVYDIVGGEYSVLSKYMNARTRVDIVHNTCGYRYRATPESFLNLGTRCPKCSGKMKRTNEDFQELVYSQVKNEYKFLDVYETSNTKIRCLHSTCGYIWKVYPANFLNKKSRCPKCAGNAPLTNEGFLERVHDLLGDDYIFLETYKNLVTSIRCMHICGHEWDIAPNNLFQGKRCPRCRRESKGEEYVRSILEELNVVFRVQETFDRCVYKKHLPFDFYIPDMNLAIEYDGEQHYRPVNFGGRGIEKSKAMFELTKQRDNIKTKYCNENSIGLLRIPYYLDKAKVRYLLLQTLNSQEVTQRDSHQNVSL
jgi:predicted Zn-ribbon and HTH transcriptional regulator